ncbi:hypothetical protein COHA_010350 [Chlorella ohadii]|uniref:Translin-associated factor X-interacting protein 1 N-terminal domain-containing protein n=1 Tax=Chlorella ohadii TaxID=2649997 RepID=A0AAD5DD24_9CHLO|nr:hypothetical protein COHA_010350 [Chlorella ohadii]
MVQRQMAHLQAGTSGRGAVPAPLRSARHGPTPGRREVFVLAKWLEVETQRFNATYARKDERTPLVEFLMLAATKARAMYGTAYAELARQVTRHCEERGRLMADVWIGYSAMLDSVLSRVHAAYVAAKERAERAEAALEVAEAALAQERDGAEAYKAEAQSEMARLRAELTAALALGGGGGRVDVASVVMGPGRSAGDSRPGTASAEAAAAGRSVRFRDSTFGPAQRGSSVGKRDTLAGLRPGSSKMSMAMGSGMRHLHETAGGLSSEEAEELQQQNEALREALEGARQELLEVYKQVADFEAAAGEVVLLESRAEAAEGERDEALEQLRAATPRPQQSWGSLLELVGEAGLQRFQAALEAHKHWPTDELAALLVGAPLHAPPARAGTSLAAAPPQPLAAEGSQAAPSAEGSTASQAEAGGRGSSTGAGSNGGEGGSHLREHIEAGLGCLQAAVSRGQLDRQAILQAVQERTTAPLQEAAGEEHAAWLAQALSRPAAAPEQLVAFLMGSSRSGLHISPSFYGCMHQYKEGITFDEVRGAVQRARMSTRTRVAALEEEVRALGKEAGELRAIVQGYRDAEQRREVARRRREEEAQLEAKSPLQQYVELLGSQDESAWKEWLIGMGQASNVPKLFRHSGRIRNKHLSKRDTEKLVKEIWRERLNDPAAAAGSAVDLLEFVFQQLQKKVGIVTAVVEAGYNFLFGLWKYQWDADCELFLRILLGEVKEDVYVAQIRLQEELEELFGAIDRAKGQATGFIDTDDLRTALLAYFKVGQPGGKTLQRFDELMQAVDEDQEGDRVEWRKVFEEDREFNQGEFAESIRDQFLQERVEYFKALEAAVYEEAGHEEECRREHVTRALLHMDQDMSEKVAQQTAAAIFGELEELSVKAVMHKLSRGVVRRGRSSSAKGSVVGAAAGLKTKPRKGAGQLTEASLRALEALRQEWIAQEVQRNQPALPGSGAAAGKG